MASFPASFPGLLKQLLLDRHVDGLPLDQLGKEYLIYCNDHPAEDDESEDSFFDGYVEDRYFILAANALFFTGAINPSMNSESSSDSMTKNLQESVYTVSRLPESLNQVTRDFGDLSEELVREISDSLLRSCK